MSDELEGLRRQIRAAFPLRGFLGPVSTCPCDECKGIAEALRHKSWDQVTSEFIRFTCSPTLLDPDAYCAFLPAYMMQALDDMIGDNVVLELTLYSLCPSIEDNDDYPGWSSQYEQESVERLRIRAKLMSPAQVAAIRGFLSFVANHAANRKWFQPFVDAALEKVWREFIPLG